MPLVSAIVASFNARPYLERCVASVLGSVDEVVVVDAASTDGSAELVREQFPTARVIALSENQGFGVSMNVGIESTDGDYLLLLNSDAWGTEGAVERLVACAESDPGAAVVGPRLLNPDGTLQRSIRGYPTPWRLATEYFFLRWLAPYSRLVNAFYGAGFSHREPASVEFLVGAVLLVRRSALAEVGAFDAAFFMFDEEVDLCYRLSRAGWRVHFCPAAKFIHVGGASTRQVWDSIYKEQLRSHLRFLTKHRGPTVAERTRRLLIWAMRLRTLVLRGERSRLSRDAARWLASAPAAVLIAAAPPDACGRDTAPTPD
jgi:GT2 family glycosyltransferase